MNSSNLGKDPARAVVIGLDAMNGLQSARILASRGIPVIGVTPNPRTPSSRTRVCEEMVVADRHGVELIEVLKELDFPDVH